MAIIPIQVSYVAYLCNLKKSQNLYLARILLSLKTKIPFTNSIKLGKWSSNICRVSTPINTAKSDEMGAVDIVDTTLDRLVTLTRLWFHLLCIVWKSPLTLFPPWLRLWVHIGSIQSLIDLRERDSIGTIWRQRRVGRKRRIAAGCVNHIILLPLRLRRHKQCRFTSFCCYRRRHDDWLHGRRGKNDYNMGSKYEALFRLGFLGCVARKRDCSGTFST